jgi:hypothetical protein
MSASAPVTPRDIKSFLLFPKSGIFFLFKINQLKTKLTNDLKNTISIAGIWGSILTERFIKEKNTVAMSMYRMPGVSFILKIFPKIEGNKQRGVIGGLNRKRSWH